MLRKAKNKLSIIIPCVLAGAAAIAALIIGLTLGLKKPAVPSAPPSPPAIDACVHKNTTATVTARPTCTHAGVTSYVCDYCHTVARTEPIAALGHDYTQAENSGLCTVCNEKICSRGLTYELSDDESYYIVSKKNAVPDGAELVNLVIPAYHDGKPVKEIAADAFLSQKYIKSVSIPTTIEYIGVGAFSGTEIRKLYFNAENCKDFVGVNWVFYLEASAPSIDVVIGKDVRRIPDRLFFPHSSVPDVMPKIKSVTFEEGSQLQSIGDYAFYKAGITGIVFPDSLRIIGDHAFDACALQSAAFGNGLTDIGEHSFGSCDKLGFVDLSTAALKNIAPNAFKNCSSLTEVKLPACTKSIGAKAFFGCTSLKNLALDGAEEIGDDAFNGCSSLTAVTFPAMLKTVGVRAFEGCSALAEIEYKATELSGLAAGNRVFYGAGTGGVSVVIAEGVKYIPARLFYSTADASNNLHIKKLRISASVKEIGEYAFRGTVIDGVSFSGSADEYARIDIAVGNAELGTPSFGKGV